MKTLFILLTIMSSWFAFAANDIVLGVGKNGGPPANLTWTAGGGNNWVATWGSSAAGPWTPTYAIRMGATNRYQYTETGLYVQKNWKINILANVRSNSPAGYQYSGVYKSSGSLNYYWGTSATNQLGAFYGSISSHQTGGTVSNALWYFFTMETHGTTNFIIYTNTAVYYNWVGSCTFNTNTTVTYQLGTYGSGNNGLLWDIARAQFIDNAGVLKLDLIATANGTFTNVSNGTTYTFGVGGAGGTSADSINISGQTMPTMKWQ